jgi:hypothetical protein
MVKILSIFVTFLENMNFNLLEYLELIFFGGFHLHLLVFPLVYQFNSRLEALVCSSFEND